MVKLTLDLKKSCHNHLADVTHINEVPSESHSTRRPARAISAGVHISCRGHVPCSTHPASDKQRKCAVSFEAGSPKATSDGKSWTIEVKLKYNYDNAWQFKSLEVSYDRVDPVNNKTAQGPKITVTNEGDITPKGSYTAIFANVTPPGPNEEIRVRLRIDIKRQGQLDLWNSANAAVPAPLPPPNNP